MATKSKIEWTQSTWNPVRGCTRVSEGCRFCYAERIAARFSKKGLAYEGLAKMTKAGPRWSNKVRLVRELLDAPLKWKKPQLVFVNSMSDLFHEDVPLDFILKVFKTMNRSSSASFPSTYKAVKTLGLNSILSCRGPKMFQWESVLKIKTIHARIDNLRQTDAHMSNFYHLNL